MNDEQFKDLVQQMRTAQRNTNRTTAGTTDRRKTLQVSQALEACVDAALAGEGQPLALDMDGDDDE